MGGDLRRNRKSGWVGIFGTMGAAKAAGMCALLISIAAFFAPGVRGQEVLRALPFSFEENRGQTAPEVRFVARGRGYALYLTDDEAVLTLRSPQSVPRELSPRKVQSDEAGARLDVIRTRLIGANRSKITAGVRLSGNHNYFIGNDPQKWLTDIPTYSQVRYPEIYRNIDLVYYGSEGNVEYDFVVGPGGNPSDIRIGYEGVEEISTDFSGDLILRTPTGELRHKAPRIYQQINGTRKTVTGRYAFDVGQTVRFEVDSYDRSAPLVIDPILSYASYLGGSSAEVATNVAVDSSGSPYILSTTFSLDFPTTSGAFQRGRSGSFDAVVTKLNTGGAAAVYSTYIGGSLEETSAGLAVDQAGSAYISGQTFSLNFPTTAGAYQASTTDECCFDGFVAKLNATGSALVYSTLIPGNRNDVVNALAVDAGGVAYLVGNTQSTSFPMATAIQPVHRGEIEGFVAKLNAAGSALQFAFLGGSGNEDANSIAIDASGSIFVAGSTDSANFPVTANAAQKTIGGSVDAFVAKFTPTLSLIYSSFLGGGSEDTGSGVGLSPGGGVFVAGSTLSGNFPVTQNAYQRSSKGGREAFVAKFTPDGSSLVFSTHLGGTGDERAFGLAVDSETAVYIVGRVASVDFPLTNDAVQTKLGGGPYDLFVARIGADGSRLDYSTLFGGGGVDDAFKAALDGQKRLIVVGQTTSVDFPITSGGTQNSLKGSLDALVARFEIPAGPVAPGPASVVIVSGNNQSGAAGTALPAQATVEVRNGTGAPLPDILVTFAGTNATVNPSTARTNALGRASTVVALGPATGPAQVTATVAGVAPATFQLTVTPPVTPVPATLAPVSGNNQSGLPGAALADQVVVEVRTAAGAPVADFLVTFAGTNASVNPATARTNAAGRASTAVTLGPATGSAQVTATVTGVTPLSFQFTVRVPPPTPRISEVLDGAAFRPGFAQAGWVIIKGANLSSTTRLWDTTDFVGNQMPVSMDGVSVTFNSRAAVINYVSPTQLNVLAPVLNTSGPVVVTVTNELGSASFTATMGLVAPTFYMLEPESRKYVAAVHLSGVLVGKQGLYPADPNATAPLSPQARASLFSTGWGLGDPPQPERMLFSDPRPLPNASQIRLTVGGLTATLEFAGVVAPGLYQFNFIAPDLPPGDHEIVAELNGLRTQPNAFITIGSMQ